MVNEFEIVEIVEAEVMEVKVDLTKPQHCLDWVPLMEEQNWEKRQDNISTTLYNGMKEDMDNIDIRNDIDSSIKFFEIFKVPEKEKVYLNKKPGCLVCHNVFIKDIIHYALLKGYCDIKTIQYFLFEKGIMYRAWMFKEHLKHIDVRDTTPIIKIKVSEIGIIDNQIGSLRVEVQDLEEQGNARDEQMLKDKRQLLLDIIDKKSKMNNTDDGSQDEFISMDDILQLQ